MQAASARSARELLDAVVTQARLEELEVDAYRDQLADEIAGHDTSEAGFAARDAGLVAALVSIDAFAARAMRIRLEHALSHEPALGASLRATLAATVVDYADDLGRLAQRTALGVQRAAPARTAELASAVVAEAEGALDLRDRLRAAVLGLARALAAAVLPVARAAASDRSADDSTRARWSSIRQELEAIVAGPVRLAAAAWAARVATHAPIDELPAVVEPSFADLIELD